MPSYPPEYFERAAEKERRRQKKRDLAKQNAKVMKSLGVRTEHFGKHWDWIADLRRAEKWGVASFSQACYFFSRLQKHGLHLSLVKKRHLLDTINSSYPAGENGQRTWKKKVRKKMKKLFQKLQKKMSRRAITRREDRDDEEPVNPADPPALIVGDNIDRYDNIVVTRSFLGPFDLATGQVDALREDPGDSVHQVHLQFPDGTKYNPDFLVAPLV